MIAKNNLFPVFLKLETLSILMVGGGRVALEKLSAILCNSPQTKIKLVAKEINQDVMEQAIRHTNLRVIQKAFEAKDLDDMDLIFVAVNDRAVSSSIMQTAHAKGKLVNVADTPDLCDFYLGSIVKKGNLKIGISTNGQSPTAAKRIKEMLNEALPDELDELIENLHTIRNQLTGDFRDKVKMLNEITRGLVE